MNDFATKQAAQRISGLLGALSIALALTSTPAQAGGDITNFNVKNCTQQRMFVCSFDKTDSLMKIPYKARGVQPGDKKEFGCASLNKCKVIIGVSKKKSSSTLSSGMQAGLSTASVGSGLVAAGSTGLFLLTADMVTEGTAVALVGLGGAGAGAVLALGAAGAVAGIEIADGWKDGEVCNRVRKAAQKAGLKPKVFMKDGKKYQVIEHYATDDDGNYYVNPDGTAILTYSIDRGKGSCPAPLDTQLVPN
ncbi:hypothetical protein B5C34_12155 [Pacificimonas flava]|uniref:Uncharacterized protein n=2 Tax=Pacificimonas TaxID=1960290 RepID=A0A219B8K6_9SPHN|nr:MULTISPECIES: hypothetical protein [Pacificimonas]MBZ6378582.1 hypothetical protein [Pacificimonas aurantium]OWV34139.1 hypothetical protein B5C34_12155 [Pacificimonas flava]